MYSTFICCFCCFCCRYNHHTNAHEPQSAYIGMGVCLFACKHTLNKGILYAAIVPINCFQTQNSHANKFTEFIYIVEIFCKVYEVARTGCRFWSVRFDDGLKKMPRSIYKATAKRPWNASILVRAFTLFLFIFALAFFVVKHPFVLTMCFCRVNEVNTNKSHAIKYLSKVYFICFSHRTFLSIVAFELQ